MSVSFTSCTSRFTCCNWAQCQKMNSLKTFPDRITLYESRRYGISSNNSPGKWFFRDNEFFLRWEVIEEGGEERYLRIALRIWLRLLVDTFKLKWYFLCFVLHSSMILWWRIFGTVASGNTSNFISQKYIALFQIPQGIANRCNTSQERHSLPLLIKVFLIFQNFGLEISKPKPKHQFQSTFFHFSFN